MKDHELPLPADLLERMSQTEQNPRYHAEGNVRVHTEMVVSKYFELHGQFELTEDEKQVLYWACVLHDVGKADVTHKREGIWRATGHEKAGLSVARTILLQQSDISAKNRHQVLDLVRFHGFPRRFVQKERTMDQLKRLGTRTDLRLLSIFALIDFHGRISEDQDRNIERFQHFHDITVPKAEYEFGKYADLQARYASWNLRHKNAVWNALRIDDMALLQKLSGAEQIEPHQSRGKKVILTVGPTGVGKTHYLTTEKPDLFRVSLEEYGLTAELLPNEYVTARKLIEFRHFLTIYLNRNKTVVLDGQNLDEPLRLRLIELIRDMNVALEYIVFEASLEEILARNAQRENPIPEETVRSQYAQFELLHPWEAHKVDFVRG